MNRCSACREPNPRYSLDGTRIHLCRRCVDALVWLAADMLTTARRKGSAA